MSSNTPRLNPVLLRRRRAELGLTAKALADALGILPATYMFLENTGGKTLDLRLVVRLARILGVSLDSLVTPAVLDEAPDVPTVDDDAKALGSLLYSAETLIPIGALCDALDWPLDRLHAAEERLGAQLEACGLRLRRSNARLAITRDPDPVDTTSLKTAIRRHLGRHNVGRRELRLLRRIEQERVPKATSNPDIVALGVLVNAELVTFETSGAPRSETPMTLSEDVRFSLMLDKEPET